MYNNWLSNKPERPFYSMNTAQLKGVVRYKVSGSEMSDVKPPELCYSIFTVQNRQVKWLIAFITFEWRSNIERNAVSAVLHRGIYCTMALNATQPIIIK